MKFNIHILRCLSIIILIASVTACREKIATPHFVHVDSMQVANVDYSAHGSVRKKITDVWAFTDGELIGAYVLPANIPVLSNSKRIELRAGIEQNGISSVRLQYPFYLGETFNIDWKEGTYKTINPVVKYRTNTKLLIHEDFEAGTNFEVKNNSAGLNLLSNADKLEGVASGAIYLDTFNKQMDIFIDKELSLPQGQPFFIELDYKCSIPFEVDLIGLTNTGTATHFVGGVNAKEKWNKIYFNTENTLESAKASKYKLNLRAVLPEGFTSGYVYIDNVKILGLQ